MKACVEFTLEGSKNNVHLVTLVVVAQIIKAQVFACRNPKSLILLSPTVVVVFLSLPPIRKPPLLCLPFTLLFHSLTLFNSIFF